MARKTKVITVASEGRDKGKTFLLTEKDAVSVEKWCARVLTGIGRARMDLPEDAMGAPSAMVMAIGAARSLVSMSFADAEPLIDEMMECIQIIPDPAHAQVTRSLLIDDIEEVATRLALRKEVLELHMGFTLADAQSRVAEWMQGLIASMRTPTSPSLSDSPSAAE